MQQRFYVSRKSMRMAIYILVDGALLHQASLAPQLQLHIASEPAEVLDLKA